MMNEIEGKFGFDSFCFPNHFLETPDNALILRCNILEGEFEKEWFEIGGFDFTEECENLHFEFNSSKGPDHEGLKELARGFARITLISIVEDPGQWIPVEESKSEEDSPGEN